MPNKQKKEKASMSSDILAFLSFEIMLATPA